jgi:protein involved in polysaccharide export with SLBB domain
MRGINKTEKSNVSPLGTNLTGMKIFSDYIILPLLISCSLWLLVGLQGCADSVKTPAQMSEPGIIDQSPESLSAAVPHYIIQPYDELEIKFYYSADLNEKVIVRPDGFISLQLIHDVRAASLSVNELTNILKNKYAKYLNDPEISVIVSSLNNQNVYVDGEVTTPGIIPIGSYMTVLQAISAAGGLKDGSRNDEIILIRKNGLKKPFVLIVNLEDVLTGVDIAQDIALKAHDIIYVPKSNIANVNTWIDLYIRRNIPIGFGYGFYHNL